ncbi:SRPBCC family protein [Hydrogenophaga sp. 5NK40-0174]|uniref:SRPBCC family protein n=1 Tax=Hydrogenophaga sp. 5NK40-0174 TaxID=3127649 RepID=UPI0031081245
MTETATGIRSPGRSVSATHCIHLALPVAQAQRLFTPAGEELWVEGWSPRYLEPDSGTTTPGMVFLTGDGDDATVWTLLRFTQAPYEARYLRVTPASRWGYVDVRCTPGPDGGTDVQVGYTLTAIHPGGEKALEAFEPEPFAQMIEGWREAIEDRLEVLASADIS